MAIGTPQGPFRPHPASTWNATAIQSIPLNISSADADLTLTTANGGQTSGWWARAILNDGVAGNLVFYDGTGAGPFTVALAANQYFEQEVSFVGSTGNGTTCTPVACL